MNHLLLLTAVLFMFQTSAVEPLTEAEKRRLAETELTARRTPAMREAATVLSEARRVYTEDRRKFPADRDSNAGSTYRAAVARFDEALRKSMREVDPSIEPLLVKQAELRKQGLESANEGESAGDAASRQNMAMKPITDQAGLPRVLLIGDSISIGYTLNVRDKLRGKANVHRIPQNGGATDVGLEKMAAWLGDGRWDVIHFNFGLHDAKFASETTQRASREQYADNLGQLVSRMQATGAKLIFATTTPVPKGGMLSPTRKFDSIEERNRIAIRLMQERGVVINDLYAVALPVMEKYGRPNDVHFAPEGYEVLAVAVASSIASQLPGH